MNKFDIYDNKEECYIKTGCTLEAIIEPNFFLSDDEVRRYFGIDAGHRFWKRAHRPAKVRRYVFDKCIIPESSRFQIETAYEEV